MYIEIGQIFFFNFELTIPPCIQLRTLVLVIYILYKHYIRDVIRDVERKKERKKERKIHVHCNHV